MEVKRVIVDEMPIYCRACKFSKLGNDYLWCKLLETAVPFTEIHDECPLELETDGWILVSERLPEDREQVLLFCAVSQKAEQGYHVPSVPQWTTLFGGYYHGKNYGFITHWRPLPEPPESHDR